MAVSFQVFLLGERTVAADTLASFGPVFSDQDDYYGSSNTNTQAECESPRRVALAPGASLACPPWPFHTAAPCQPAIVPAGCGHRPFSGPLLAGWPQRRALPLPNCSRRWTVVSSCLRVRRKLAPPHRPPGGQLRAFVGRLVGGCNHDDDHHRHRPKKMSSLDQVLSCASFQCAGCRSP